MGRHAAVGGDLQHVAQPELTHGGAQERIGAVDLVAGHPAGRHAGLDGADEHRDGQRRLGRKRDVGGHPSCRAALLVVGPRARQVQGAVDQGMPAAGGVGHEHRDLRRSRSGPTVPVYCRCTPTEWSPCLRSPVSSITKIASGSPNA